MRLKVFFLIVFISFVKTELLNDCPSSIKNNFCQNGGKCKIRNRKELMCTCSVLFTGRLCEIPLEAESKIPAVNVGITGVTSDLTLARINGLNQHNIYRNKHYSQNLELDDNLNSIAQAYADYLVKTGLFEHSSAGGLGENLYKKWDYGAIDVPIVVKAATDSWYSEIAYYDFSKPVFSYETGHFTAVVWKATTKVGFGVGVGKCLMGGFSYNCAVVVANYKDPGNYVGQFSANVLRPY